MNAAPAALPDGWNVAETRTVGGSVFYRIECLCGYSLNARARLGELQDHICAS